MPSLLDDLGGRDAIELVVAGLAERLASDPVTAPYLADVARGRLEARLVSFLCAFLGPHRSSWHGRDLRATHDELGLGHAEVDRFLDLFAQTLAAAGVSAGLARRAVAKLETLRPAVVTAR